jgi:hypothetical protein
VTATVIKIRRDAAKLECSACGATTNASCDCGVPYTSAGMRAAEAIAVNPEKSDRAIAAEIGVGSNTVSRARKSGAPCGAPKMKASENFSPCEMPERRTGKDGKSYPAKRKVAEQYEEPGIEDEIDGEDPENYRTAYLLRSDQAIRFASYSGPVTKEIAAVARRVAAAWSKLAQKLEKSL